MCDDVNSLPSSGRVTCTETDTDGTNANAINIDLDGVTISTTANHSAGYAISAEKAKSGSGTGGTGNISIEFTGAGTTTPGMPNSTPDIKTTGTAAVGIFSSHVGTGSITVDVEDATLNTAGESIRATGTKTADMDTVAIDIDVRDSFITTTGDSQAGVLAEINNSKLDASLAVSERAIGEIDIKLEDTAVRTEAAGTDGIFGSHGSSGKGALNIEVDGGSVTTTTLGSNGFGARGIVALHPFDTSHGTSNITDRIGTGDIEITVKGDASVTTKGHGIDARHQGQGDISIAVTGSSVTTQSLFAHGIFAEAYDSGLASFASTPDDDAVKIKLNNAAIKTESTAVGGDFNDTFSVGVYGRNGGIGHLDINTQGSSVETAGKYSYGIYAEHSGPTLFSVEAAKCSGSDAMCSDNANKITISTKGEHSTTGKSVSTTGDFGHGIVAYFSSESNTDANCRGCLPTVSSFDHSTTPPRTIDITVGGPVTTTGLGAQGVRVGFLKNGVELRGLIYDNVPQRMAALDDDDYRRQTVTVNGPIASAAEGVFLANGGRVIIGPQGSIDSALGIAILAVGSMPEDYIVPDRFPFIPPKLRVDLNLGGAKTVAMALNDGWIINDRKSSLGTDGETTIAVNGVVLHEGATGVTGNTAPNGVWDVRMVSEGVNVSDYSNADPTMWTITDRAEGVIAGRDFSASDFTEVRRPPPPPPPPESEPEGMEVNEELVADEDEVAAVHIEGDGAVHIGPQGSVRAASGIAILASGDTPALSVSLDLDGRQMGQVIGDDWIINDGGGTTIIVNGVTLHDATTGVVPDAVAPNGAHDVRVEDNVRIREAGVRVLDRSDPDPANWVLSDPAAGVIADRDFSAADFIETADGAMPRPPMMMIEEYAPRAAVYEALPQVLLGLQERMPAAARPQQPAWLKITGHTGAQEFGRSTVGAECDMEYFKAEAGKHFTLKGGTEAWAILQYLDGTADVDSPVQGGDIDVQGLKISLQLCRGCQSNADTYVSGSVSLGRYDLDLASDTRGTLKSGVGATSYTLALEAGRRLQQGTYSLSPRLRLEHASVSIDRFTDAVDARVSYPDADHLAIALGVKAETAPHPQKKDGMSWWGSLDLKHRLDDTKTTARVSGQKLSARAGDNSILVGLGGSWQRDRLKLDAGLSAREGLDGSSESYGASLDLSLQF